MNRRISISWGVWFLALLCLGLIAFKWEALHLPFFWDEAWVYMPAIRTMAESGPSIMPASIDADLYTGHPLLFYCMASAWIKMFGYSLPLAHSFPLLISVALLISVYVFTYRLKQETFTAALAALFVAIQPMFLAQSTFLLIEVWLGLLFVCSFYFYFTQKWWAFALCLVMALWSKESAFTLIPAFGLLSIYAAYNKQLTLKTMYLFWGLLILCFALGFSFFIIQKIKLGWYFFPRHANWINFSEAWFKFKGAIYTVFISQGRATIFLLTIGAYIWMYSKRKHHLTPWQQQYIVGSLIFAFGYIVFASINFISSRYLFGAIPLWLIGAAIVLSNLRLLHFQPLLLLGFGIIGFLHIRSSMFNTRWSDVELSYTRMLKAQVKFTEYITQAELKEKTYAPFLVYVNLTNPYAGMVNKPIERLSTVSSDDNLRYYIRIPNEPDEYLEHLIQTQKVKLVKRISEHQAWVELYEKNGNN